MHTIGIGEGPSWEVCTLKGVVYILITIASGIHIL